MRKDKFDNTKDAYDSDDIKYAFQCNGKEELLEEIDVIVAEVCGANDEYSWYWILQLKNGEFMWASGWCDYTGWDCQSGVSLGNRVATPEKAIEELVIDEYDQRKIKEVLTAQIQEKIPFAVYQEHNYSNMEDDRDTDAEVYQEEREAYYAETYQYPSEGK